MSNFIRKNKLALMHLETKEKFKNKGIEAARDHIELYLKIIARTSNPFERQENIQACSFIVGETIIAKAFNKKTKFTYLITEVNLSEENNMDSESSSQNNNLT